jgi:predicted PurR-regulated permease PerM
MEVNKQTRYPLLKYLEILFFTVVILYFGKTLFIPLFFGLLIAIVMYPVCKRLEKHGWNKTLSIAAALLIVTILLAGLVLLLVWQISLFSKDAPAIISKLETVFQQFIQWLSNTTGIAIDQQGKQSADMFTSIGNLLLSGTNAIINTLFIFFLVPVYTALFLYHRKVFIHFLKSVTPSAYQHQLDMIVQQTIHTYFNYIKGMVLVYIIVGILNSIGLFALGVKHPLLFGMLCAIMTIIPYVGIIVSALLPISVIWLDTGNIWYPIGVVAVFSFVQYLEANVIFPKVVGTQLHVSTFAMLVAIIAGGIIWSVAGMVLFIPFVAILKIVTDHIEEWKPLNLLLSRK